MTHHGPNSGGATTILPIVFFVLLCRTCTRMTLFPGTPKVESRNCHGFGLPGLWDTVASRLDLRSGRGLNQTCSPFQGLSNAVLHSPSARWERVDSRILMVGSQTASLTPDASFAHNLGCNVQMTNARPFRTSTFQDLSNDTKNTPRQGVLPLVVEL
jgi:hypothetical protein